MATKEQALIQTQGLGLGYGSRMLLEQADLSIKAGEFWFLLGKNGTGKSTFLKTILGLLRPHSGSLHLHPLIGDRRQIGFVPQQPEFNPSLPTTVREFVSLGTVGANRLNGDLSAGMQWALEHVGLGGMERENYWSLSGGQRQRALVARALARKPKMLLMDEPTSGLDPAAESSLMTYLSSLNREEGLTILCVSHDLATANHYATHVALIDAGRVVSGLVADVLTRDNILQVYGAESITGQSQQPFYMEMNNRHE